MATVKATYKGQLKTEAEHLQSTTRIVMDAPTDNHGKGESFSPTDLVATALGGCVMTIIALAAQTHGFTVEGTQLAITKIMGTAPRRIIEIVVDVYLPQDYDTKMKRIIEAAGRECPVAQSLHPDLKQTLNFHYAGK